MNVPCGDLAIFGLAAPPHEAAEPVPESAASPPACPREEEEAPPGAAWSRRVRKLGQLLGLESVAAHWTAIMERRLCHLKGLVRSRFGDTPFLVVGVDTDGYRVFGPRHPGLGDLLYISGGFTPCRTVHGLREVRVASLDEVAAFGCRTALFLVQGQGVGPRSRRSGPTPWDRRGPAAWRWAGAGWRTRPGTNGWWNGLRCTCWNRSSQRIRQGKEVPCQVEEGPCHRPV